MIKRYKTLISVRHKEDNPSLMGNDIITVWGHSIVDAICKTDDRINDMKKLYPEYKIDILYGPKLKKEFNPGGTFFNGVLSDFIEGQKNEEKEN